MLFTVWFSYQGVFFFLNYLEDSLCQSFLTRRGSLSYVWCPCLRILTSGGDCPSATGLECDRIRWLTTAFLFFHRRDLVRDLNMPPGTILRNATRNAAAFLQNNRNRLGQETLPHKHLSLNSFRESIPEAIAMKKQFGFVKGAEGDPVMQPFW